MKVEKFLKKMFDHAKPAVLVYGPVEGNLRIERATLDVRHAPVGFAEFGLREVTGSVSIQGAGRRNPQGGTTIVHFRSDTNPPGYIHILTLNGPPPKVQAHVDRVAREPLKGSNSHIVSFTGIRAADMSGQSLDVLTIRPHRIYQIADIDKNGEAHYSPTGFLAYDISLVVGGK